MANMIPAITELRVISGDTDFFSTPSGFIKIDVDLNRGAGGKYMYLCFREEQVPAATPYPRAIAAVCIIRDQEAVPQGFEKIDVDLNAGAGGKYIYLCFTHNQGAAAQQMANLGMGSNEVTDIQAGKPIRSLCVIDGEGTGAPAHFVKLNNDLNEGSGGAHLYLCFSRHQDFDDMIPAITELRVISGDTDFFSTPSGFIKIDVDLNKGAGGKYMYLCFREEQVPAATPYPRAIATVCIIRDQEAVPQGFEKIDVDLNAGAGGKYIYLCFTHNQGAAAQQMANLGMGPNEITDIQAGKPIRSLCVIDGEGTGAPAHFVKLNNDLNEGSGGAHLYLCYARL